MWRTAIGLALLFAVVSSSAAHATPRLLIDEANVIDAPAERKLERSLRDRARATGATMVVHVVRSLDGKSPEEVAQALFDASRPGRRGEDRAALLLVAPAERSVRLHVGYGLEGQLNDGKVGALLSNVVVPSLRAGDLAGAIGQGIEAVYAELDPAGTTGRSPPHKNRAPTPGQIATGLVILLVALCLAVKVGGVDGLLVILHLASADGWRPQDDDDANHDAFAGGASGGGGASREW